MSIAWTGIQFRRMYDDVRLALVRGREKVRSKITRVAKFSVRIFSPALGCFL